MNYIFSGQASDRPDAVPKKRLTSIEPKLTHNGTTFVKCRYLHKLIIDNEDEEILRRRTEISSALLCYACQYKYGDVSVTKVDN